MKITEIIREKLNQIQLETIRFEFKKTIDKDIVISLLEDIIKDIKEL